MDKIKIGAREETYTRPSELVCWEIAGLAAHSPQRAALAALAASTRAGRVAGVDLKSFKGNMSAYAEAFADKLPDGLSLREAIRVGSECLTRIASTLITEDEVKEAEGNSETPRED